MAKKSKKKKSVTRRVVNAAESLGRKAERAVEKLMPKKKARKAKKTKKKSKR